MDNDINTTLIRLLELERQPVGLQWTTKLPKDIPRVEKKSRFCTKLDQASRGQLFYTTDAEEECLGGAKYCGLRDSKTFAIGRRSGEFLVGMGVYKSVPAVQRAWQDNLFIEPGIFKALAFAPLTMAPFIPDVIVVLCNAMLAMKLLHANTYDTGIGAIGADARPICSSMAAIPYLTGKVTYGFGDVGSRKNMNLGPGEVMVSIPGSELLRITSNLEEMQAKNAFH